MTGAGARERCDVALVGGGLANGLIAYRLKMKRPDLDLHMFEAASEIGGNHTWSFHDGDLDAAAHAWLAPFVTYGWPAYDVRFPGRERTVATGYRSVSSERFRRVVNAALGDAVHPGVRVGAIEAGSLTLADGRRIEAGCVIDGRGHAANPHLRLGYQKFLGREIELSAPHGLSRPVVMDATVPQADGYRFVYLLPLGKTRLLVEDTYYADGPDLDEDRLAASIDAYVERRGWRIREIAREERGVLPIALDGDIEAFWKARRGVAASGLAAALFHPTTGYSLPDAVALADRLAGIRDLSAPAVFEATRDQSIRSWKSRGFFRMLNRLLFLAGRPDERYKVLEHFHRLPDDLIARFYAARLKPSDRLRVLSGKPPVPLAGALRVIAAHGFGGRLA